MEPPDYSSTPSKPARVVGCLAALGLILGLGLGLIVPRLAGWKNASPVSYNTSMIIRQVQGLSEMVTVKYVMEKLVILEDVKWYGENRVLLVAHGIAKGGIDFREFRPEDLTIRGTNVFIKLPPATITDVYLDEKKTQVIERTTGLMRNFDKDLEQEARRQAVDQMRRAARFSGILDEANERGRRQLTLFFEQLGMRAEFVVPE